MVSTTLINGLFLKDECGSCKRNVWCHKIITIINMNIWLHERMSYECVIPFFFSFLLLGLVLMQYYYGRTGNVDQWWSVVPLFILYLLSGILFCFQSFFATMESVQAHRYVVCFFLHSLDAYVQWLGLGILYSYLCCACPFNSFHCLIMEQYACIV